MDREKAGAARKPRADAERNRSRLIEVARAAFASDGAEVSLDEIARRAGVGIGTLYRHFPTRVAVLEAVYLLEVEQLAEAARRLSAEQAPLAALRAWMRLFVDYIATKKIITAALSAVAGNESGFLQTSGAQIRTAMAMLVDRAVENGDLRADVAPIDLLYALFGFVSVNTGPDWEAGALGLIDILIAGSRPGAPR